MLFSLNFHIFAFFRKFKIGQKLVENPELTPLVFGEIFPP